MEACRDEKSFKVGVAGADISTNRLVFGKAATVFPSAVYVYALIPLPNDRNGGVEESKCRKGG